MSANGLRIKRPETALLPALALKGTAALVNNQATFDARTCRRAAGRNFALKGKATIPQGNAPLAASVAIERRRRASRRSRRRSAPSVRNVAGTLQPNLTSTSTARRSPAAARSRCSGRAVYLPASGMRLTGGQATVALQGDTLQLQRLGFQTARNGEVSASGTVRLDPAQGFPVDLAVTSRKALAGQSSRPARDRVEQHQGDGLVNRRLRRHRAGDDRSRGDRHRRQPGGQLSDPAGARDQRRHAARPDAPKPPPPAAGGKKPPRPPEGVRLELTIDAPQAVFVRGRGLDAEVGGQFTVKGNPGRRR